MAGDREAAKDSAGATKLPAARLLAKLGNVRAALALALVLGASTAAADSVTAAGGLGVGIIDDSPATVFEAGLDVSGDDYALGLGGRVSMNTSGEVRREDWDQPGEWATIIRYVRYRRPAFDDEWQLAIAAGQLSNVELGFGALVDGYASGVDINHRHLGAQVRAYGSRFGGSALIDDVVSPRITGARGYYRPWRQLYIGVSGVADLSAPTMDGSESVVGTAIDVALASRRPGRRWWAEAYGQTAAWRRLGAGAHLGARAQISTGGWRVATQLEGQLGSDGYIAGYVDDLYERNRFEFSGGLSLAERARQGGLSGIGGLARVATERVGLGSARMGFGHRAGLGKRIDARISSAELARVQLAAKGAYQQLGASNAAWLMASEVRVKMPFRLYGSVEAARLFRRSGDDIAPAWWIVASLGAVFGEP